MTKQELTIDLRPAFILDLRSLAAEAMETMAVAIPAPVETMVEGYADRPRRYGKRMFRGAAEWLSYAVIFAVLVWGTPIGLTKYLHTEQPIASITSSSMWPVLKKGDIVLIRGVSGKNDIAKGDIVVYDNSKGFTIHRVVRMNDATIITRGDANNVDDSPVPYDKVVGKAVTWSNGAVVNIPWLGNFSQSVQQFKGYITKTVQAAL